MVSIFVFISIVNTYNVNRQDMLYLITFPDRSKCHYINKYIVKQFDLLYNIVKYGLTVVERSGCFYTNVLHSISCFHGVQLCLSTTKWKGKLKENKSKDINDGKKYPYKIFLYGQIEKVKLIFSFSSRYQEILIYILRSINITMYAVIFLVILNQFCFQNE